MFTDKKSLRKHIKSIKLQFNESERLAQSELIFSTLEACESFIKAKTILAYWSMDDEVFTHSFIEKWWKKKAFFLPSVNGDELEIKEFQGIQSMKPGEQFSILEPSGPILKNVRQIDLIIVPGVAFDKSNKRMGRGRGYYDKLLNLTPAKKTGICFDFQFFDSIPTEPHDIAMDKVIHA